MAYFEDQILTAYCESPYMQSALQTKQHLLLQDGITIDWKGLPSALHLPDVVDASVRAWLIFIREFFVETQLFGHATISRVTRQMPDGRTYPVPHCHCKVRPTRDRAGDETAIVATARRDPITLRPNTPGMRATLAVQFNDTLRTTVMHAAIGMSTPTVFEISAPRGQQWRPDARDHMFPFDAHRGTADAVGHGLFTERDRINTMMERRRREMEYWAMINQAREDINQASQRAQHAVGLQHNLGYSSNPNAQWFEGRRNCGVHTLTGLDTTIVAPPLPRPIDNPPAQEAAHQQIIYACFNLDMFNIPSSARMHTVDEAFHQRMLALFGEVDDLNLVLVDVASFVYREWADALEFYDTVVDPAGEGDADQDMSYIPSITVIKPANTHSLRHPPWMETKESTT